MRKLILSASCLLLLTNCHRHDDETERDTKGRAGAAIGTTTTAASSDAVPIAPQDPTRQRWASDRVFPIGADVDGDGTEDVVGPTVKTDGANAQLYVSAFDGKTGDVRWSAGPFGAASRDVEANLPVVVAGQRVVVIDPKGDAHLYELATGKLVVDFPFTERHHGMCGPPGAETKVLVRVGDSNIIIDTATAKSAKGAEPAWCANHKYFRRRPSESFNSYYGVQADYLSHEADSDRLDMLKPPPKATVSFAFADGPLIVGIANPMGGSAPLLLGFNARGVMQWQYGGEGVDAREHVKDLAYGRFVFVNADKAVVAVDAKTGNKIWETPLTTMPKASGRGIGRASLTQTRVWVTRRDDKYAFVQAFDAATGTLAVTAGN